MHENSVMADLLKKIEAVSRDNGGGRVVSIRVKLGALSHITRDLFEEHFLIKTRGTPMEGARLKIEQMTDTANPNAQEILLESIEFAF